MNVSATFNFFKLFRDPALCLPHATISNFNHLPIPLSTAFAKSEKDITPDIRAVVLDKDNCFAKPRDNEVYEPYIEKFKAIRAAYPGSSLLIVSNSAGTGDDHGHKEAELLQKTTGIKVLRHSTKKPGCGSEVLAYLKGAPGSKVTEACHVAVVGDRLFTDVMMANMMGSWSVWVKNGVVEEKGLFTAFEGRLAKYLLRRGFIPPMPISPFEE